MPYLGSTVFVVALVALFSLTVTAYWLAASSLAPGFVSRAEQRWRRRPVVGLLLGSVIGGIGGLLAVVALAVEHPVPKLAGAAIVMALGLFALAGTTGLARRLGRGLASPSDEGRAWFWVLKGGAVLVLLMLMPFVGWFVIAPIALLGGLGAATQAIVVGLLHGSSPELAHAPSA